MGRVCPAFFPWRSDAALALSRLGRDDEALEVADAELALARRFGAATCVGIALRARALVGLREEAEPYLLEAVAVLETSPAQLELARALVDLGSVRRRAGDRTAARVDLRRGAELAVRCGAQRLSARAHEEMLASGARPRRIALKGVESLTPSERRVAQLAAGGSTNRQIAQELFVTEKTVEGHLARVFDKLDVRSRTVLPQALHSRPAA
jgi:DNA-binding CsgD family transcriptional regulator